MERIERKNLVEELSVVLLRKLKIDKTDTIYYLKCKLGLEFFLVNFYKLVIIYIVAWILNIIFPVFVFHFFFLFIRGNAQGAHASSDFKCAILSLVLLVGVPWLNSIGFLFSEKWLFVLFLLGFIITYLYAPSDSKKNPIYNKTKRKKLRKKALIAQGVVTLNFIIPLTLLSMNLIILGAFTASVLLLPKLHEAL